MLFNSIRYTKTSKNQVLYLATRGAIYDRIRVTIAHIAKSAIYMWGDVPRGEDCLRVEYSQQRSYVIREPRGAPLSSAF